MCSSPPPKAGSEESVSVEITGPVEAEHCCFISGSYPLRQPRRPTSMSRMPQTLCLSASLLVST
jgi:hypothetical protein